MSEINANIVVEPIDLNVTQSSITQTVTVEPINLGIFTSAPLATPPGGTSGQLQFNDSNTFGGVTSTLVSSGNLTFTNLANLKINGGINGYVLQTDGTGILSWTAQTGSGGSGNPGGANTQIQYNDAGVFGGDAGFTFNNTSGIVNMPTDLNVVSDITSTSGAFFGDAGGLSNVIGSNLAGNVNAQSGFAFFGDGYGLSNIVLGNIPAAGNVASLNLDGNVANVLRGDGTFSTIPNNADWDSVANIALGDIFIGKGQGYGGTSPTVVQPGGNISINGGSVPTSFVPILQNMTGNIQDLTYLSDGNFWCVNQTAVQSVGTSSAGNVWQAYTTPCRGFQAPIETPLHLVIADNGTSAAAYSTDFGITWNSSTLPSSSQWTRMAYNNGNIVLGTKGTGFPGGPYYNYIARSTDEGLTWSQVALGANTSNPLTIGVATKGGISNEFVILSEGGTARVSTDGGVTWSGGTSIDPSSGAIVGRDLIFADGYYVALWDQGISYRLPASSTWTAVSFGSGNYQKVIYADPYWIAFDGGSDTIQYSTNINGPYTAGVTNAVGSNGTFAVAVNTLNNQIFGTTFAFNANAITTQGTNLQVTSSDGNYANAQNVPTGTYRALGASTGDIGGLWTRLS